MRTSPNSMLALPPLLALAAIVPAGAQAEVVTYEAAFVATWSEDSHPLDFPPNPHFSGLVGGTHNASILFWEEGALASPGIERMAETGNKTTLISEVEAQIVNGSAFSVISGGGIGTSPGQVTVQFEISDSHPQVTLVSMIAPSPDWFVGVSALDLRENGRWRDEVAVGLYAYDSGTDSGATYTSPNQDTVPPEPIRYLHDEYPFDGTPPLATFTFRLLSTPRVAGDLNCDGAVDGADIDPFFLALGDPDSYAGQFPDCDPLNGDINGDDALDGADIDAFFTCLGDGSCGD